MAISAATRTLCKRCLAPLEPRPPSFSVSFNFGRRSFSAGASPNSIPVSTDNPAVKPSTCQSIPISSARGNASGSAASTDVVPAFATINPSAPPAAPRSTLSVSNCRITRHGLAPSAARIANSLVRPVERASNRFATFAHAMSSTKLTAPSSTSKMPLTSPTIWVFSGTSVMPDPLLESGYASARLFAIASTSARACSIVTPAFSRPTTRVPIPMRRSRNVGSFHCPSGTYTCVGPNIGTCSGATPTTVYACPFRVTFFPTMSCDIPNRLFHKPSLIIATGAAPGTSSSGWKARPAMGGTPSRGKNSAEIIRPRSRTGSPDPVRLKSSPRYPAIAVNVVLSLFQSRRFR